MILRGASDSTKSLKNILRTRPKVIPTPVLRLFTDSVCSWRESWLDDPRIDGCESLVLLVRPYKANGFRAHSKMLRLH